MESYFERLQKIGTAAVVDLRKMDAQHSEMERSYLEDRRKGNLTEKGYQELSKTLDDIRSKKVKEINAQIASVQKEYNAAVDEATAPNATMLDTGDVEILKNFELTAAEFDRMADKHRGNPTMCRFLDSYRKDHNVKTDWRYQSCEMRKDIFNSACSSVESIVKQMDKYNPDREGHIAMAISRAYHKLQGSKSDIMPVPEGDTPVARHSSFFF